MSNNNISDFLYGAVIGYCAVKLLSGGEDKKELSPKENYNGMTGCGLFLILLFCIDFMYYPPGEIQDMFIVGILILISIPMIIRIRKYMRYLSVKKEPTYSEDIKLAWTSFVCIFFSIFGIAYLPGRVLDIMVIIFSIITIVVLLCEYLNSRTLQKTLQKISSSSINPFNDGISNLIGFIFVCAILLSCILYGVI